MSLQQRRNSKQQLPSACTFVCKIKYSIQRITIVQTEFPLFSTNGERDTHSTPHQSGKHKEAASNQRGECDQRNEFMTKTKKTHHPGQLILRCGQHLKSHDSNVFLIIHPQGVRRQGQGFFPGTGCNLLVARHFRCRTAVPRPVYGFLQIIPSPEGEREEMDYPNRKRGHQRQ